VTAAEMQACLARLYTQDSFRKLFLLAPDLSLEEYGLDPEERAAIRGIDHDMLERFASQLRAKQRGKLVSAFPILFRLGGEGLEHYVTRYFSLYLARPHESPLDAITSFGSFMEATLSADDSLPPYLADITRYERLSHVAASRMPVASPVSDKTCIDGTARPYLHPTVELTLFRHDIPRLVPELREGVLPAGLTSGEYGYIFQPSPDSSEPHVLAVNSAAFFLLSHCDGSKRISQLARMIDGESAQLGMVDEVIEILEHLAAIGVVGIAGDDQHAH
jgi:hypothetical protein